MKKKSLVALLALTVAMPIAMARADDTTSTTPTPAVDCGSRPTRPATGATTDQLAQFRTQMQDYAKCAHSNGRPNGGMMGKGAGFGGGKDANLAADRQQVSQDKCTLVGQRMIDRINKFQSMQTGDKSIFGNIYGQLNNIQTRIKNAGIDTTKLATDLGTLQADIDKVNVDYASFITNLQKVQSSSSTCGQSGGQFANQLVAARGILTTVRSDRQVVRTFVTDTIVPEIKSLRQQLQSKEGTDSATSATPSIIN